MLSVLRKKSIFSKHTVSEENADSLDNYCKQVFIITEPLNCQKKGNGYALAS